MPENKIKIIETPMNNILLLYEKFITEISAVNEMKAMVLNFDGDIKYCDVTPATIVPAMLINGRITSKKFFVFSFPDSPGKNVSNAINIKA